MIDYEKEKARIKKEMALLDIEIDNYKFSERCDRLIKQIDYEVYRLKNMRADFEKYKQFSTAQISKFFTDLENEISKVHGFYVSVASTYNKLAGLRLSILKLYNAKIEKAASNKRRRKTV